jgi:ferredoxin
MVDRTAFDRIIQAGGYISANTGGAPDANAIRSRRTIADRAMDAAECIGCGACVAACPNASAMLFTSAKISQLGMMPQGQPERWDRARNMVSQMEAEGFGGCTNIRECEAVLPQGPESLARTDSHDPRWQMVDEGGQTVPGGEHPSMQTLHTGQPVRAAVRGLFAGDPSQTRWLKIDTEPVVDEASGEVSEVLVLFEDITSQKERQRALEEALDEQALAAALAACFLSEDVEVVLSAVLELLRPAFDSPLGYFGYIDTAGDLVVPSLRGEVWQRSDAPVKRLVFPRSRWAGLFGRSLLEARALRAEGPLDAPEGLLTLAAAIAVPLLDGEQVIGQFVLANREGGYDDELLARLERVAGYTAPLLKTLLARREAERAQSELRELLQQAQQMEVVGQLAGRDRPRLQQPPDGDSRHGGPVARR